MYLYCAMIKLIPLLFLVGCAVPKYHGPLELAGNTNCDPARIAYWIGQHEYKIIAGWNTARQCMAMPAWDCKCSAMIAKESLLACGFPARVQILRKGKKTHAVAIYTDRTGRRGFINGTSNKVYEPGTEWADVIEGISGGPWTDINNDKSSN